MADKEEEEAATEGESKHDIELSSCSCYLFNFICVTDTIKEHIFKIYQLESVAIRVIALANDPSGEWQKQWHYGDVQVNSELRSPITTQILYKQQRETADMRYGILMRKTPRKNNPSTLNATCVYTMCIVLNDKPHKLYISSVSSGPEECLHFKNHTPLCLLLSFCTTEYLVSITINRMLGRPITLHLLICLSIY